MLEQTAREMDAMFGEGQHPRGLDELVDQVERLKMPRLSGPLSPETIAVLCVLNGNPPNTVPEYKVVPQAIDQLEPEPPEEPPVFDTLLEKWAKTETETPILCEWGGKTVEGAFIRVHGNTGKIKVRLADDTSPFRLIQPEEAMVVD